MTVMPELIDLHVLADEGSGWGGAILELGRAEQLLSRSGQEHAQSVLLRLLVSPHQVQLDKEQLSKLGVRLPLEISVPTGTYRTAGLLCSLKILFLLPRLASSPSVESSPASSGRRSSRPIAAIPPPLPRAHS